jgi:hypothetical protein
VTLAVEEETIARIAAVLAEWNPLGARARTVVDLDGYRIEAIDMIMALQLRGRSVAPEKTVCDVLNQAFELTLKPNDCLAHATTIQAILKNAK